RGNGLVRQVANKSLSIRGSGALRGRLVRGVAANHERDTGLARPGAAIGFYRARRHPEQVKAIAYYEAVAHPRRWDDFSGGRDRQFRLLRSPEGERLVLDENMFVEVVLPRGILRKLTDEEMEAYRAPYRDRERRLAALISP